MSKVDFPSRLPLLPEMSRWIDGLVLWVSGTPLNIPDHWWYWSPSRVIPHPPIEASPITEFPLFTFLFADLHAHLMAMPIVLLTLATLTALVVAGPKAAGRATVIRRRFLSEATALAILALAIGSLAAINTWDLPTALGLTALALLTREVQRSTPIKTIVRAGWRFALVAIVGRFLFLPFHANFAPGYSRIEPWLGSRTPISAFLVIHALFLLPISAWLVIERRPWQGISLSRAARWPLDRVFEFWGLSLSALALIFGFPLESLLLALVALAGGMALTRDEVPRRRLVAVFVLTGATLALAVEHFVLVGDISRMNTVFKIYLQTWILWSLASTIALADLLSRWRSSDRRNTKGGLSVWAKSVVGLWLVLLLGAVAYPIMGIPARVRDRFEQSSPRGLDGRAFMDSSVYHDENGPIELRWDAQAIRWLDQNVSGSPVVLEASVPIYRWGSRISVHTGLPTVLGWDWHQHQQRKILKNDPVGRRRADVATLFSASETEEILPLLRRYRVRYIIIGQLERLTYPASGLDKFTRGKPFREVYRNSETIIYEVDQTALSG